MGFFKRKQKESPLCALHIDDSNWVRIPVSVLLRRHFSMRVLEASGGAEGIAIAVRERPDLIILDVMMPLMDGFDTLHQLKSQALTRDIPVIMCTARDITREVNTAVRLGAVGYLTKPIDEEALTRKVEEVLRSIGKWNTLEGIGRNRYQIPPDLHNDLVIPRGIDAAAPFSKPDAARRCSLCRSVLEFVMQYDAWYCRPCRKYPEIES